MATTQDVSAGTTESDIATSVQQIGPYVEDGVCGPRADSLISPENSYEVRGHDPLVENQRSTSEAIAQPSRSDVSSSPDIRYRVEYRQMKDYMLLATKDARQSKEKLGIHEGPVFDVVELYYTLETRDTRKNEEERQEPKPAWQNDTSAPPPSVHFRGNSHIRIYSRAIINALQSVVNYYPGLDLVEQPLDIDWPYAIVVHHWEKLREFRESFKEPDLTAEYSACSVPHTYKHLGLLLDFVDQEVGEKVRQERERWKQSPPKASFEMLWLLLKPGINVYEQYNPQWEDGSKEPWILENVDFDLKSWDYYKVNLWYLGNNATSIRAFSYDTKITRFHGEKPIDQLSLFPCEFFRDHDTYWTELVARGKLMVSLQQKKCMYFEGESCDNPRQSFRGYVMVDPVQAAEDEKEDHKPELMVDQKASQLPLCSCKRCSAIKCERQEPAKFKGWKSIAFKDKESMTDHQYFISANNVMAFVLSVREWKLLFVKGFKEPNWNPKLMDSLVLKDETKKMLQNLSSLYMQHSQEPGSHETVVPTGDRPLARPWNADYIEDKGKGLVLLLHGKPGVGKTYTAECIAHSIKRPLLSITCADIGVAAVEVETKLRRWFKIARRWNAVLLIDEADIYFESRQTQDLDRNNLVAAFLRAIEYYDGILFLTTNRIGTSDEAVWSRIHTTIYYDDFDNDQRQQIWNTYFKKLEKERQDIIISESARTYVETAPVLKESKWNGREIRNAFQIAVNLAQAEDARDEKGRFVVERDHIKVTADLLKDFKEYMHTLHKKSASQRAQREGLRYDAYNHTGGPRDDYY
ncbi:ATP binding [Ascochyta rabiei]|uniref:ATP binding n=1 Tax=Didymella rabiei TaxID=5454 RepID=A0A163FFS9_DIDRA|nr:ATP binding [Ascochyta rabiei]